ncbi:CinY protein [Actinomadura sp. HBU206391]|uniref:CinY protein n=1 Tax=Actinomadura sp. HBU206391 TaxID=2731692 RepID=UPI00164FFF09|nr:CinY protein [Actinomadura sp. HBU206391]MBC6460755.1 CinY protein [Actinomadura sp. HBU206391]
MARGRLHSRGTYFRILAIAAALIAVAGLAVAVTPPQKAEAFATYYWYTEGHGEHEKVTRAALRCPAGRPSDGSCFEPQSLTGLAGVRGYFGGVGRPDHWLGWAGELDDEAAHCDNADFATPANGGDDYPRTRQQASDTLIKCVSHLRGRFHSAAQEAGNGILDDDGDISYSNSSRSSNCQDNASPGAAGQAKCRVLDYFGRALHGVQDFYAHSNWADSEDPTKATSLQNPVGLKRTGLFPLLAFRSPMPGAGDVPEDLSTGCYPSSDCAGRIRHDEELNKDRAIIDENGNVTLDENPTNRGRILDNEQRAVTGAINDTRRQWADQRAEIIARYGEDRGNKIICVITHDYPVGFWWWETGDCE